MRLTIVISMHYIILRNIHVSKYWHLYVLHDYLDAKRTNIETKKYHEERIELCMIENKTEE